MEGDLLLNAGAVLFAAALVWFIVAPWLDEGDCPWIAWTLVLSSAALCVAGHLANGGVL